MRLTNDELRHLCDVARSRHPAVLRALEAIGPIEIRPTRFASVADQLYVEIVNQQLSSRAADTIWGRIVQLAASRGREPASLFDGGFEAELRECGVSGNKVRALRAVSEAARDGLLDTAELRVLPHEERAKRLCAIRGIGRWTADMIGIVHFLDPDIWPAGDVAAVGMLRRLTGVQDSVAASVDYAPFRSILARYMWRIRHSKPEIVPEPS